LSNGRLAVAGSSLRVLRARMALNPPTPSSQMAPSEPPASIASALPLRIRARASPRQCVPDAQAVTTAKLGPFMLWLMEIRPGRMFEIICGIMNGEKRPGPRERSTSIWACRICNPPTPEAATTPIRVGSSLDMSSPESATAILAAAMP
jgi:hypothetical protein